MQEIHKCQHIAWVGKAGRSNLANEIIYPEYLSEENSRIVRKFHEGIETYSKTPLVSLESFAEKSGIRAMLVKDESHRFGLKAFKGLGSTYALFRVVCEQFGLDPETTTQSDLLAEDIRKKVADMVFITTTDGNHGKGVAWAAGLLGCKAYIYMPKGTVEARAQAIRDAGRAQVQITDMGYDDCVRYTAELAKENGWFLIQDTSWDGYEKIPAWIIQGYTTLFYEAVDQMKEMGYERPTHVFLQSGVGSMAGSILGAIACTYREKMPVVSIVEPTEVACFFESARVDDGAPHKAVGSEVTIMAGLNCAEPCTMIWPVIRDLVSYYFACDDCVAAHGMRFYANPIGNDSKIISGESGSVTGGLVALLVADPDYKAAREALRINKDSVILVINTESDTYPEGYKEVVEQGAYPLRYQG